MRSANTTIDFTHRGVKKGGRAMPAKMKLEDIPIASIEISPMNVRKVDVNEGLTELEQSIAEIGLQQPVVVYPKGDKYRLIIGQRRYLACKNLGWDEIPAIIRQVRDDTDAAIISFSENIHRLDLGYRDKMRVAVELLDKLKSVKEVAKRLGVTPQTVRNYLGYDAVPEEIKKMVDQGAFGARTAWLIASSIPDKGRAVEIAGLVKETPSSDRRRLIIETAIENPGSPIAKIRRHVEQAEFAEITLHLTPRLQAALQDACREYGAEPPEIAIEGLEDWLGGRGFLQ